MVADGVGIDTSYGRCWAQPAMQCSLLACMALFFTADTHFGDPSILHRRVWATSVDEHDEVLIAH